MWEQLWREKGVLVLGSDWLGPCVGTGEDIREVPGCLR